MRLLFEINKKYYDENGTCFSCLLVIGMIW